MVPAFSQKLSGVPLQRVYPLSHLKAKKKLSRHKIAPDLFFCMNWYYCLYIVPSILRISCAQYTLEIQISRAGYGKHDDANNG